MAEENVRIGPIFQAKYSGEYDCQCKGKRRLHILVLVKKLEHSEKYRKFSL